MKYPTQKKLIDPNTQQTKNPSVELKVKDPTHSKQKMKKCIQFQQFDLKRWKELKEMRLGREQKIDTTSKRHKFTLTDQRVARLNSEENQSQGPKIGTKNREPQV